MALSSDRRAVAVSSADATLRMWDVETAREILRIDTRNDYPRVFVWSDDRGTLTVVGEYGEVTRWDGRTGKRLFRHKGSSTAAQSALSPDGRRAAVTREHRAVRILETETGKVLRTLDQAPGHGYVTALAFSPDGAFVVWTCGDHTVLSEVETGKVKANIQGGEHWPSHGAAVFSPDGALFATGGDGKTVRVFETASGREIASLKGHLGPVTALGFAPNGDRLASGSVDRSILIWKADWAR